MAKIVVWSCQNIWRT